MADEGFDENKINSENAGNNELLEKLEDAYKVYKLSEVFLYDVSDDYGKQKIARLRLEFARHELLMLIEEARNKGVEWQDNELVNKFFYPDA